MRAVREQAAAAKERRRQQQERQEREERERHEQQAAANAAAAVSARVVGKKRATGRKAAPPAAPPGGVSGIFDSMSKTSAGVTYKKQAKKKQQVGQVGHAFWKRTGPWLEAAALTEAIALKNKNP